MKDPAIFFDQRPPYLKGHTYNVMRRSKYALLWDESGEILALKEDTQLILFTEKTSVLASIERLSQLSTNGTAAKQLSTDQVRIIKQLWERSEHDHVVFNHAMQQEASTILEF